MNMNKWIPLHSVGICTNEADIRQFMGHEPECLDCNTIITNKGQVICYGNIKFVEFCDKHIKTCSCGKEPGYTKQFVEFLCSDCYKTVRNNDNQ